MGVLDILIILVVLISGLLALYRGLVRELLGLLTWLLAAFGAFYGLALARPLFRKMINNPTIADIVAAISIALIILIVCTIINAKINEKLRKSVLSGLDRVLGFFFGIVRGGFLILFVYFFAAFAVSSDTLDKYIDENYLLKNFQKMVPSIEKILPDSFVDGLKDMRSDNLGNKEDVVGEKTLQPEVTISYDNEDLENMDVLLETIEE